MEPFDVDYASSSSSSNNNSGDYVTRFINTSNAKKIAFFYVLCSVLYHGILSVNFSIDSCKWLLSDGRFHHLQWQPYGCIIKDYDKIDTRMCLRHRSNKGEKNNIIFLGDSRIRQLFYEFINETSSTPIQAIRSVHHDINHLDSELRLNASFKWCPIVNESMFQIYRELLNEEPQFKPTVIITGTATWRIKENNASEEALENFSDSLTKLLPLINKIGQTSQILWILQHPVIEQKLADSRKMITNEQIDLFNKASISILKKAESDNLKIWGSSRLVAQGEDSLDDQTDGLHISKTTLEISVKIFLNFLCNAAMNYEDGSCCSEAEKITNLQIFIFTIFSIIILVLVVWLIYKHLFDNKVKFKLLVNQNDSDDEMDMQKLNDLNDVNDINRSQDFKLEPSSQYYFKVFFYLGKFSIIMIYFYIADRTNYFMKENKYYTLSNFLLPILYLFVHGFFFTEESKYTHFLHRDQSSEWKGWMQLIILIYHLTGASRVLSIYMFVRLLVSSYLFLSGFGHFTYYWKTGDTSLHRFCTVVFRTNLLVVSLCFCMNRTYQFYYFVPLITFWYTVMHITMAILPVNSRNAEHQPISNLYMVFKFVALLSIITVLYMSEVLFKKIFFFSLWKFLFTDSNGSIDEWWFRWRIDRYTVPSGMIFAFLLHLSKQYGLIDDSHRLDLLSKNYLYLTSFLSFLGLVVYISFTFLCPSKSDCNEIHPYAVVVPIICYIFLRNLSSIRTKYSSFFSWFGKISLELFICQYHIWLASDTYGVLVLIPSYPVLNVIITSFIFLFVVHELNLITKKISKLAIPDKRNNLIRNICILYATLVSLNYFFN